jgi:hypothetical protein
MPSEAKDLLVLREGTVGFRSIQWIPWLRFRQQIRG